MEFLEANEIIHKDLVIKSYTEMYRYWYLVSITMVIGLLPCYRDKWKVLKLIRYLTKTGVMATKHVRLYNFLHIPLTAFTTFYYMWNKIYR